MNIKKVVSCMLVALVAGVCFSASGFASDLPTIIVEYDTASFYYIDNGEVRLGVDLSGGGSVFYFAQSATGRNLLNHFDKGRFVQQSYYGNKDGSLWAGKPWTWNPIQGGGYQGDAAKIIEQKLDKQSLYIKSRPKHWATGKDVDEAVMEQYITLEGDVAHIRYIFTYTGEITHVSKHQELPAVFVDAALPNLVYYNGKSPWKANNKLTSVTPGWPNEGHKTTEHWAAYVDNNQWGIGVFTPGTSEMTAYTFKGDGTPGPKGSACSYFAPVRTFSVAPGLVFSYDVYMTIGNIQDIRNEFMAIHKASKKAK